MCIKLQLAVKESSRPTDNHFTKEISSVFLLVLFVWGAQSRIAALQYPCFVINTFILQWKTSYIVL